MTFNGNCREAMIFYQSCLGGDLTFQHLDALDLGFRVSPSLHGVIVHACLQSDTIAIMGTDLIVDEGFHRGNTMALLMQCDHKEEIYGYYERLIVNGIPTYPLTPNAHGHLFGGLTDRYGTHWLFSEKNKKDL